MSSSSVKGCVDPSSFDPSGVNVIIMDRSMPVCDGVEATSRLREMGVDVPIVGLTGNALDSETAEFAAAGAEFVLTKPVNSEDLKQALVKLVAIGRLPGRIMRTGDTSHYSPAPPRELRPIDGPIERIVNETKES